MYRKMIWGMTLEPGKLYTEVIGDEVQLSMASLESRKDFATEGEKPEGTCHIIMKTEKSEYLLCTLANGVIYQQSLDLKLMPREKVTFSVQGPNMVYLTGYSTSYPDMDDHYEGESETGEWEPYDTGGEMTLDNSDLNESAALSEEGAEGPGHIKSEAIDPADESVNDDASNQIEGGANQDIPMETPSMADESSSQPLIQPKQEPGEESDQQDMIFSIAALDNVKQEPQDSQDDITIIPEDDDEDDQPQQTSDQLAQQQLQLHEQQQLQELQSQLQQHSNQLQQQQSNQYMQQQQAMMQQRAPVRARGFPQMRRRGRGRPAGSLGRQRQRFSQPAGAQQTFQQNQPMGSSYSQMMPTQGSSRMPAAGYQGTPGQRLVPPTLHQDQAMLNQPGSSRQAAPGPSTSSGKVPRGKPSTSQTSRDGERLNSRTCRFCHKVFSQSGVCKRHERIHAGVKRFQCFFCPKGFTRADHCRLHERTHGLNPIEPEVDYSVCPICRVDLPNKRAYQFHLLSAHPDTERTSHTGSVRTGLGPRNVASADSCRS